MMFVAFVITFLWNNPCNFSNLSEIEARILKRDTWSVALIRMKSLVRFLDYIIQMAIGGFLI